MSKDFLLTILVTFITLSGAYVWYADQTNVHIPAMKVIFPEKTCVEPLEYSIGTFDTQFDITKQEFRTAIAEAAAIWEKQADRDLFAYDSEASFEVDLIFDERQRRTIEQERTQQQLSQLKNKQSEYTQQYENIKAVYERERDAYQDMLEDYQEQRKQYEEDVRYWNQRGGAPEEEYEKLQREKDELNSLQAKLQQERQQLNALVTQLNRIADESNEIARVYQNTAETYEQRFGQARRFNQGEYQGDQIQVYQFADSADLRLVLVHELGHALGIGHVDDPQAVMHKTMRKQAIADISLTKADIAALQRVCNLPKASTSSARQSASL